MLYGPQNRIWPGLAVISEALISTVISLNGLNSTKLIKNRREKKVTGHAPDHL